ncbi:MAG TPA: hybrid sensor histidine kinase/response regulator, partial [Solibacterales bacterium]|nr:hybrid sensor histidine kinase/response regulator [Bryobacterales bacterium]
TDNVNSMAANLTTQVRGIAKVVTAVANGDLKRKLVLETKGEIAELADTINEMIDTLAVFADQVTTVAREVGIEGKLGGQARVPGTAGIWRDLTNNVNQLAANLTTQVRAIADVATAVTKGDLTRTIAVEAQGEVAALKENLNQMISNLAETTRKNTDQDWLKTNIAKFTGMVQGQKDLRTVSQLLLSELTPLVGAQRGTFYIADTQDDESVLKLTSAYAFSGDSNAPQRFHLSEGLIGQCAFEKERILLTSAPSDYMKISSSLGESTPLSLVVLPVLFEGEVKAVVELASFRQFSDIHLAFLDQLTKSIGIVLNTIAATMRTDELLKQSQALAEELQKTNEELQEKAQLLAEQKTEVERKNREVEQAKQALEDKAEQLALTSKYKSEFLANMSHELRTPLNNLLILAKMLADNAEQNLVPKQVKFAETIHSSGTDLLALINDILDLSKIESGKMDVELGGVRFTELQDYVSRNFRHVAEGKSLDLAIELDPQLPSMIHTDVKRLQQVLKNLLSNALKFTSKGGVVLKIEAATDGWRRNHPVLNRAKTVIAFSVIDTGIGIAGDKQKIIFEAFQQADGTTSRRFGGTGLGLSISRELARLLGGEIRLRSEPGHGSTFTLYLPQTYITPAFAGKPEEVQSMSLLSDSSLDAALNPRVDVILPTPMLKPPSITFAEEVPIDDDRNAIKPGDRVLLVVEDDATFARILVDLAHQHNLKVLVASRGATALLLASEFKPTAITLDIGLPDMGGWTLLDRLKHDAHLSHIPVHIISGEENTRLGLALGAMSHVQKAQSASHFQGSFENIAGSLEPRPKHLLVATADRARSRQWERLLSGSDIRFIATYTGEDCVAAIKTQFFDCVVLDLANLETPFAHILTELERNASDHALPTVLYKELPLTYEESVDLKFAARSGTIRFVQTQERLLDETTLLLHRRLDDLSDEQRATLERVRQVDSKLAGRKALVVDDDLRNIFALTSILEHHDLNVVHAENGRAGIEVLQRHPDIDVVLMDIMMPEMDGYETMRAIRNFPQFSDLPIIALTAKAMKGDREKCIEAGASDYVTKPVDLDQLFSVLRVWVSKTADNVVPAGVEEDHR